jgi:hypothetical protein
MPRKWKEIALLTVGWLLGSVAIGVVASITDTPLPPFWMVFAYGVMGGYLYAGFVSVKTEEKADA